ncbi:hypothetical protein X768_34505 [Mesorhizobium sp. LSJC265A00]|nr:hypothetical protein X768_34505 [Mesorhizobium sp. LSJC265A00]
MKPIRNPRLFVFMQIFTETYKSRSIDLNGTAIRPGRRRFFVLFDESRCVISDERGVGRVGIPDRAVDHWRSARQRLETTQCSSHDRGATPALVLRGATPALVLLAILIQRRFVKPSSKSRPVIVKEPTTKAEKRIYMALDRALLDLTRVS